MELKKALKIYTNNQAIKALVKDSLETMKGSHDSTLHASLIKILSELYGVENIIEVKHHVKPYEELIEENHYLKSKLEKYENEPTNS